MCSLIFNLTLLHPLLNHPPPGEPFDSFIYTLYNYVSSAQSEVCHMQSQTNELLAVYRNEFKTDLSK